MGRGRGSRRGRPGAAVLTRVDAGLGKRLTPNGGQTASRAVVGEARGRLHAARAALPVPAARQRVRHGGLSPPHDGAGLARAEDDRLRRLGRARQRASRDTRRRPRPLRRRSRGPGGPSHAACLGETDLRRMRRRDRGAHLHRRHRAVSRHRSRVRSRGRRLLRRYPQPDAGRRHRRTRPGVQRERVLRDGHDRVGRGWPGLGRRPDRALWS